ncbi:carbon storage regulator [Escherichia coli]|nr:carbon storage regulator [Escherichia coli]
MLILTRRVGETLMIGDEVTVTVFRGKGQPGTYWRKCPEGSFCSP